MKSIAAVFTATLFVATLFIASAGIAVHAAQSADSQKANQLLSQAKAATMSLHAMTTDISCSETQNGKTVQKSGTVKLLKPNYLSEELWTGSAAHDESAAHEILASDGQSYWQVASDGTLYKDTAAPDGSNIGSTDSISTPGGLPDMAGFTALFFVPSMITQIDPTATTTLTSVTWNGQTYQVVAQTLQTKDPTGKQVSISAKLYIGSDNLIHRVSIDITTMGSLDLQLSNVKTDASLTKADFAFTPPSWTKAASPPAAAGADK